MSSLHLRISDLDALRRSGTVFSRSQTDVIRQLAETGRLAEAQVLILDELDRQYGGAARAARDTLGGALTTRRTELCGANPCQALRDTTLHAKVGMTAETTVAKRDYRPLEYSAETRLTASSGD